MSSPRGVECRSSGSLGAGNYTMVFTFANNLVSVSGASVTAHNPTSGTGTVSGPVVVGPTTSLTAKQCAVNLTNVSNAQYITVTLNSVVDIAGNRSNVISPQMGVLVGDVNADGQVDSGDLILVKRQTLQPVNDNPGTSNFREDVNADRNIDSGDLIITKRQTLTGLPTPP